jgi:pyruvate dehydrogenase E1 component alpha subunit
MEQLSEDKLLEMYRTLLLCRSFDEKVLELNTTGLLGGWQHLGAGHEAIQVGVCMAVRKDDYMMISHRGFHSPIAKGLPVKKVLAHLAGRATGSGGGKGHLFDLECGVLGLSGTLGGAFPIAVGAALGAKLRGTDQVAVCFFGDGTANRGPFHEAVNLASVWKLPVVFVCENNRYAISMKIEEAVNIEDIADRAAGYGIPGVVVDGMDVIAVYEAAQEAVKRAREGGGATLIEGKTYRFRGHWEGDPVSYRTQEELEAWKKKCPVATFRNKLADMGVLDDEIEARIKAEVQEELEEAIKFAQDSPLPEIEDMHKGVYTAD